MTSSSICKMLDLRLPIDELTEVRSEMNRVDKAKGVRYETTYR
jgi:hypothetical protein